MRKIILIFLFAFFTILNVFSQCPTLDFSITGSTCKNGNVIITNNSTNASQYEWDFCEGDLDGVPTSSSLVTLEGSSTYQTLVLAEDDESWYGFVTGGNNNRLYKLSFGSSITNTPSYQDIGNISGVLKAPGKMGLIKEGDNWVGLISNSGDSTLVRLTFGSSLNNIPTATTVLPRGSIVSPRDINILYEEEKYIALVNSGNNALKRFNFGNSLSNTPSVTEVLVTGASTIIGIASTRVCNNWVVLITSSANGRVYKLNFGPSLLSNPTISNLTLTGSTTSPNHVYIAKDKGLFKAYVSLRGGIVKELNFGADFLTNTPTTRDLANLGFTSNLLSFTMAYDNSSWIGMGMDLNSGKITKITFPDFCSANRSLSDEREPVVNYSAAGTYTVTLTGTDTNGNKKSLSKQIIVDNREAPLLEISKQNECISLPTEYTTTVTNGQNIATWQWDFDDPASGTSNVSNLQNPTHQFSSPGIYNVKLVVTNDDGCTNTFLRKDTVYNTTASSFSVPSGVLCSNQNYTFVNTSTGETGPKVKWNWEFLDSNNNIIGTSDQKDGAFKFLSGGDYIVRLKAGISDDCGSVYSLPISVIQGPTVDYSYTNNCRSKAVLFSDLSTGTGITGNTWEIRNSSGVLISSASNSPTFSYLFPSDGNYQVSLIVSSNLGCNNYITKTIAISSAPKLDFSVPFATENVPVFFEGIDQAGNDDDVTNWVWDFAGSRINGKNATYAFSSPGLYDVKLIVSTIQGCKDSVSKSIVVEESICPSIDFNIEGGFCIGGNTIFNNKTRNALKYEWDFCDGDLEGYPTGTPLITLSGSSTYSAIALAEDGDEWFGFVTGGNNRLYRLAFGTNVSNIPSFVDLGNLGGVLNSPGKLRLVKEGSQWIGLVSNGGNSNLVRLEFGETLNNTPTGSLILPEESVVSPRDMEILYEDGTYFVLLNSGNNKLVRLNFGNSLFNVPNISEIFIPGASTILGISSAKVCNEWVVLITSYGNGKIHKLSFGKSISNNPIIADLNLQSVTTSPNHIYLASEKGLYKAYVACREGIIKELNFDSDFTTNSPTIRDLTNLGFTTNLLSYTMAFDNSTWVGMGMDLNTGKIHKITFPDACSASLPVSEEENPIVRYNMEGTYTITLKGIDGNGNISSLSKQVTIGSSMAPLIETTKQNECVASSIAYTADVTNSQTITSWYWDFNDPASGVNNISTLQKPSHQFSTPGIFKVKLLVTSENGCTNTIIRNDTIFDETHPEFVEPAGILCSNVSFRFDTLFSGYTGTKVKWLWDFGDGNTSTEKFPAHTYAEGGTYTVTLTAGVEGCSNTFTKDITVIQGPKTSFTYQNYCLGETTQFINTTTGDGLTSWSWDFGDGTTTDVWSPENTYTKPGRYPVTLTVTNANGCVVTKTDTIQIWDLPVALFTPPGLLCSKDSLQFTDISTLSDGNIVSWQWEISRQSAVISTQNGKDAKLFFPEAGEYKVRLVVTSEMACTSEVSKDVAIVGSPEIEMQVGVLCGGDSTLLEGISTDASQNIVAWIWELSDGSTYHQQSVNHKFAGVGVYQVYLTAIMENGCPRTIVKEITINPKPVADFSATTACVNSPVLFEDLSSVIEDEIVVHQWRIYNEQLTMINEQVGVNAQFAFDRAGVFVVELSVTSGKGCVATVRKNVTVHALPVAQFSFEPEVGPPPFDVEFKNTTTGGSTYLWDFGTGVTSTDVSPQYTFTELGAYEVKLIAFNEWGCSDTTTRTIRVAPPQTSVALEKVLVSTLTEELTFAVEVKNTGSKIIRSIDFVIDFGGSLSFKETWTGQLNPEERFTYNLNTKLQRDQLSRVPYICITAPELNGEPFDLKTNTICMNLTEQFLVFGPNPNPAQEVMEVGFILPEDKSLEVNFYTMSGQRLLFYPVSYSKGYNQASFNISRLAPGMYFVEFVYDGRREKRKLMIK